MGAWWSCVLWCLLCVVWPCQGQQPEELTNESFRSQIGGDSVWIILFRKPKITTDRSKLFTTWGEVAVKSHGLLRVGVVDSTQAEFKDLVKSLNVKPPTIVGFPSAISVPKKEYEPRLFRGTKTVQSICNWGYKMLPTKFVAPLKTPKQMLEFMAFQPEGDLYPRVLYFSNKAETTPLYKALSLGFADRMLFGEVNGKTSPNLAERYEVTEFPTLIAFPVGDAEKVIYSGEPKIHAVREWVEEYALPMSHQETVRARRRAQHQEQEEEDKKDGKQKNKKETPGRKKTKKELEREKKAEERQKAKEQKEKQKKKDQAAAEAKLSKDKEEREERRKAKREKQREDARRRRGENTKEEEDAEQVVIDETGDVQPVDEEEGGLEGEGVNSTNATSINGTEVNGTEVNGTNTTLTEEEIAAKKAAKEEKARKKKEKAEQRKKDEEERLRKTREYQQMVEERQKEERRKREKAEREEKKRRREAMKEYLAAKEKVYVAEEKGYEEIDGEYVMVRDDED